MKASHLIEEFEREEKHRWGEEAFDTILRALRLLAATEVEEGTPELIRNLRDEADLCRNETATDIADLLDDAAASLTATGALYAALKDERNALAKRLVECQEDAAFRLSAQSREAEEARFYRYLRDEAGQLPDDHDGPMICSGLGDNFDYLRGEECDIEIRTAIDAARRTK